MVQRGRISALVSGPIDTHNKKPRTAGLLSVQRADKRLEIRYIISTSLRFETLPVRQEVRADGYRDSRFPAANSPNSGRIARRRTASMCTRPLIELSDLYAAYTHAAQPGCTSR
ncbi:hypothetical protein SB772_15195 [Paraburkholderia sp. SIMBA_030]